MGRLLDEDDVVDWLLKRTEMYDAAGHFVDENVVKKNIESQIAKIPSAQPEIIRCKDCEYGEQDEVERWFCRSLGCQIGNEDGSGYCADAKRRTDD